MEKKGFELSSPVALGVSKCSLATSICKSGCGSSFKTYCRASNRVSCRSASEMALVSAPVSMRSSLVSSSEIHWKIVHPSFVVQPEVSR